MRAEKKFLKPAGTTTATETAISTIAAAAAAAAAATCGAIPIIKETMSLVSATTAAAARAGWLVAVLPHNRVPTASTAKLPGTATRDVLPVPAAPSMNKRTAAPASAAIYETPSFAAITTRTTAAPCASASVTALSRQTSASSSIEKKRTAAVASNRSVVLESAVLHCEKSIVVDINRASRAQASATAATAIPALDVEAFHVDVSENQNSRCRQSHLGR